MRRAALAWLAAAVVGLGSVAGAAHAASASPPLCDRGTPMSARQQDRLLRFAAATKEVLEASGHDVALLSRSGLDLGRFDLRYSHAGVSVRASADARWSVRQLYFACDERRPRLYDQGLAGFLSSTDDPRLGYVSIVLLPGAAGAALEPLARDNAAALALLGADYSANAYAYSARYQNCNQWLVELLATAWGGLGRDAPGLRERAQQWLAEQGYDPRPVDVGSHWLMAAAPFVPWIHLDDHPEDDRYALRLRISLPRTIEGFVHARLPQAERVELCHDERHIVVHRGWQALGAGCEPGAGDRVIALD